jgi:shikimate dehydrogenase
MIPGEFGLLGFPLSHSFSRQVFGEIFQREKIADCTYELFPLSEIRHLPELLSNNPRIKGLNVTIPYKKDVIFFFAGY